VPRTQILGPTLFALLAGCSNGDASTSPQPQAPASIPAANLQNSGQMSWFGCLTDGSCGFTLSITNSGSGCASGISAVTRFYNANNQQVGSDVQMTIAGGGLPSVVLRPSEILVLYSLPPWLPYSATSIARSYRVFPAWTNVRCP